MGLEPVRHAHVIGGRNAAHFPFDDARFRNDVARGTAAHIAHMDGAIGRIETTGGITFRAFFLGELVQHADQFGSARNGIGTKHRF